GRPYTEWMDQKRSGAVDLPPLKRKQIDPETLHNVLVRFGYTKEDIKKYMEPLTNAVKDPIGAMGFDQPLAFLSGRPKLIFDYFKQHFAQVTNPPLDSYREKIVTSEITYLGGEGHLVAPDISALDRVQLERPVIDHRTLDREDVLKLGVAEIDITYTGPLDEAIRQTTAEAVRKAKTHGVLVLTDEKVLEGDGVYVMPSLLITSAVHQELIGEELRTGTSIITKTAEVREVHHVAALISFGANAVLPYIAQETMATVSGGDDAAVTGYNKALIEGLIKVMAKMRIATFQSYHGAQVFEAVGLGGSVMEKYFGGATSIIGGLSIEAIDLNNKKMQDVRLEHLEAGSKFQ